MHVAATYDGATIRLYVNGVEENHKAASFVIGVNTTNLGIGAEPAPTVINLFQGLIDDARVYDRALTLEEIQTLAGANHAPVAVKDSYSTAEDTALTVAAPGRAGQRHGCGRQPADGGAGDGPEHGTLTLAADGSFIYTPAANYNGADSFTYKANDGAADSNVATVTLTVTPVNDAPVAVDDSYSTAEDTALTVAAPGVLGNDTDVDGDPLTAVLVSDPAHGTLALNADGSFTYTPAADYNGATASPTRPTTARRTRTWRRSRSP